MSYTALHNHTMYSLLDGFSTPKEYLDKAKGLGLKGFTVTEHGNQYSWVYFDKIKKDYPDIKINYGIELYECLDMKIQDPNNRYFHLLAIAKNENGRKALNGIITQANLNGFYYKPRISIDIMKPYADDLIISSACLASKLAKEIDFQKCIDYIKEYKSIFPHFYLEMQSHIQEDQIKYNEKILKLSKLTNTPFVITTDSHVATKEDLYYQARHVQIAHDSDTLTESYEGCYLQSEEEIYEIMTPQIGEENVKIGLENTNIINNMIEVVDMPFQEPELPHYPLPKGFKSNHEYLKNLLKYGWNNRNIDSMSEEDIQIRRDRLDYELSVINQMKYDGYFLIVWDFINYAKSKNIALGAGRGSGAGSFVCYLLGITNIDPIKYGLIFERFLNPDRISMPDLDIDLGDRDKIIKYIEDKYGVECVAQILNFSYITPKVAIKDVGKVLGIPYKICEEISGYFVTETFEETMEASGSKLKKYKIEYPDLFDVASKISGKVRQVSTHACGLGVVNTKITDYMGIMISGKGEKIIQVDKIMVEEIGIVKLDLLGIETLNKIQQILKEIKEDISIIDINDESFENDQKSYKLLQKAFTDGIFQLESAGMKNLLLEIQPQNLLEVSDILALYRPDTMGLLQQYIDNKNNPKNITYIHEDLKPILENTFGCMIYQEQMMEVVRKFGGLTYAEADVFRKGIGKKDRNLVQQEAEKLYQRIIDNGYTEEIAKIISEDMKEKGGYSFNKSHAISYAVLSLQTAYLKSHYPVEFMMALLNANLGNYSNLGRYIAECNNMKIKVLPPDLNKSQRTFSISNNNILFGLGSIKGMGDTVTGQILNKRSVSSFASFTDFLSRCNPDKTTIISLIKSGAIVPKNKKQYLLKYAESIFPHREYKSVKSTPTLKKLKEEWGIEEENKEIRLEKYNKAKEIKFQLQQEEKYKKHIDDFIEKYMQDEYLWEFETLSMFITNNPFDEFYSTTVKPFHEVKNGNKAVVLSMILDIKNKKDKNNNKFCYLDLYNSFEIVESICWSGKYYDYHDYIKKGYAVAILGRKNEDKLFVEAIKNFNEWKQDKGFK